MAQVDTGLGWSAKDGWLMETSGQLATIEGYGTSGSVFDGFNLPVGAASPTDVINGGCLLWEDDTRAAYAAATESSNMLVFVTVSASVFVYTHFISLHEQAEARYVVINKSSYAVLTDLVRTTGSYTYVGDQHVADVQSVGTSNPVIYAPTFADSSAATALSATLVVNDTFTKVNTGYAVACIAKWKTSAGTTIETPILISTDSSFSEMASSSQLYFATYRDRRDGRTFYMGFFQNVPGTLTSPLPRYDISGPDEPYANLDEIFNLICAPDQANVLVTESVDPYEDFGNTEEDAGEVDPDPEDDDIEEEDLPTMSFATAGFCRIYRPSFSQVSALASYMWTDQNFLQTVINHLKQILENPIDAIISLSIVPCVPNVLADEEVKVMYVPTGVYMPPVQRQFVSVDCGTYTLKEMYGSALDYNPYTSVQLYLPYVGIVQLDTDEVMGKTISIGYRIDVVTGVCCAYVKAGGDVLYQFSGHCSIHQPITSADFSGYINAALAAGKLVASIAAAGAGAPAVAATLAGAPTPSISGTESKTVETERNPNTGRQITVGTRRRESQTYNPGASFGEVATRGVSNTVGAVMNSKTIVQHSGGFSGNSGFMAAVRRPYLIVTRPRIANPENYGKYNGRPSMIYLNLGECTGFTQVQSIQLTGIDATNPELSEIATLLNSGVIL